MRYNPPPNWPPPPHPGWQPPPGWQPNPQWGPPPPGWPLWVDDAPADPSRPAEAFHATPSPGKKASVFNRAAKHPVWISVATAVSTLSVIAAGVGYWATRGTPGDLETAAVTMSNLEQIDGFVKSTATGSDDGSDFPTETAPVDVTVKNSGDAPITITEIRGEVIEFEYLEDCGTFGGGPAQLTASYSLQIPTNAGEGASEIEATANEVTAPADFTVQPDSVDRLQISFGPDKQNISFTRPILMAVKLTLVGENGESLDIGTAANASTSGTVDHIVEYRDSFVGKGECNRENLAKVNKVVDASSMHSPLIDRLKPVYEDNV